MIEITENQIDELRSKLAVNIETVLTLGNARASRDDTENFKRVVKQSKKQGFTDALQFSVDTVAAVRKEQFSSVPITRQLHGLFMDGLHNGIVIGVLLESALRDRSQFDSLLKYLEELEITDARDI